MSCYAIKVELPNSVELITGRNVWLRLVPSELDFWIIKSVVPQRVVSWFSYSLRSSFGLCWQFFSLICLSSKSSSLDTLSILVPFALIFWLALYNKVDKSLTRTSGSVGTMQLLYYLLSKQYLGELHSNTLLELQKLPTAKELR